MTDEMSPITIGELQDTENQIDVNSAAMVAELQNYGEPCRIMRNCRMSSTFSLNKFSFLLIFPVELPSFCNFALASVRTV